MTRHTVPLLLALSALTLSAQSYGDRPAFGGSKVFSEGLDPMGNSARFDQLPAGWYAGWEDGDLKPRGFRAASDALAQAYVTGDATQIASALGDLQDKPWARRTQAYGLQYSATGGLRVAFSHERLTGTFLPSGTASPAFTVDARQADITRIVAGAGSGDRGTAYGFTVRIENIRLGQRLLTGVAPQGLLDPTGTNRGTWSFTSDAGFTYELSQGLRFGVTVDRILPRHFQDVYERPQGRVGFELDLGNLGQLRLEGDVNEAARLPLPQREKALSASLRLATTPVLTLLMGAERRLIDGRATNLFGVSVRIKTAPLILGFGLNLGDDRTLKAASVRLGG